MAALAVASYHFGVTNHLYHFPLIRQGGPYVDFFFVLSGFVVSHAYSRRLESISGKASFMLRRFGRLWPLHVFTLACFIALELVKWMIVTSTGISAGEAPFSGQTATSAIPLHLAFLQAFGIFDEFTWNGPSWSIAAEFWTYLAYAVARSSGKRGRVAIPIALMGISFGVLAFFNDAHLGATYDLGFFRCVFGFFSGSLTYDIFTARAATHSTSRSHVTVFQLATSICTLGFVASYANLERVGQCFEFVVVPAFAALVYAFACDGGRGSNVLTAPLFRCLGQWSFSIYLMHYPIIAVMNGAMRVIDKSTHAQLEVTRSAGDGAGFQVPLLLGDAIFAAYLVCVIACASLTWKYVEEPMRKFFNGVADRWDARIASASNSGTPHAPAVHGGPT